MLSYLWGGKKNAEAPPENDDPELAMREALDAHGEFKAKIDGTFEWDDYLVFRAIIMRQAQRMFKPKKTAIAEKRLEAYREKNQSKYVAVFREQQIEF